ncbi:5972_t:CDS:1, partial [Ambispora gerdemannii]
MEETTYNLINNYLNDPDNMATLSLEQQNYVNKYAKKYLKINDNLYRQKQNTKPKR